MVGAVVAELGAETRVVEQRSRKGTRRQVESRRGMRKRRIGIGQRGERRSRRAEAPAVAVVAVAADRRETLLPDSSLLRRTTILLWTARTDLQSAQADSPLADRKDFPRLQVQLRIIHQSALADSPAYRTDRQRPADLVRRVHRSVPPELPRIDHQKALEPRSDRTENLMLVVLSRRVRLR